ncbi:DUF6221 family protein [Actinopolymorpha sp. B17G11]|uniref:DUF6221 family protein n=1 Tax=Actinopolymorpha sp. B17G11 TaxID=3160861 RepID=UPI0032E44EC5
MTLADFLLARIDDDEAKANAASHGRWEYQDVDGVGGGRVCDETVEILGMHYDPEPNKIDRRIRRPVVEQEADGNGWHIVNWAPARVLAECESKRGIVAWALDDTKGGRDAYPPDEIVDVIREGALTPVLKLLALPYAAHPDYREEWKP